MIIAPPELLVNLAAPWARLYGHSDVLPTVVTFLHVVPVVVGGGLAIALDRSTLRVRTDDSAAAARHLDELGAAHPVVLGALSLSFVSGLALLATDVEIYFGSWIFWVKLGFIMALLANGALLSRTERAMRATASQTGAATGAPWRRLRALAVTSIALWLTITLAGVALLNLA